MKETLRLYAPVKSMKRMIEGEEGEVEIFTYLIAEPLRSKEIFGEDAEEFNIGRIYTKQQEEKIREAFGKGELKCIAGLPFVQYFCGAIIKEIMIQFERVDEGEWERLSSPLINRRGLYEDLHIVKV